MQIRIAIIISEFNKEITDLMEKSALERIKELGLYQEDYIVIKVPGALELPIIAKKLALTNSFNAIILLGAVIRGETDHYEFVCNQVSYGCQKIALEQLTPIIFGVLTCDNEQQALERIGGKHGNKPKEMVDVAIFMGKLMQELGGS